MAAKPSARTAGSAWSVLQERQARRPRSIAQALKDKSTEPRSGYWSASGNGVSIGSEVGSLAGRGSDADSASSESLLEDSENPWTCALVLSGPGPRSSAHTRTTATTSEPVVRGRVSASSQTPHCSKVGVALLKVAFPAAGLCRRPVPGVLPRREHAGHCVPVPVPAVSPIRVPLQYLCLNTVTVACLVQILAHQQPSRALPVELLTTSRICLGLFARRRS